MRTARLPTPHVVERLPLVVVAWGSLMIAPLATFVVVAPLVPSVSVAERAAHHLDPRPVVWTYSRPA